MLKSYLKLSLSKKIYISTAVGLLVGLFFGDRCSSIELLNTLFIKLFQIAIIPYMIFSIIHSIGSMTGANAKLISKHCGLILLLLWGLSILFALGLDYSFPDIPRSKFYSPLDTDTPYDEMLFDLFIPANPFHAIAHGAIPAIVIFCVLVGLALIKESNKSEAIKYAGMIASVMKRVNSYLTILLPLGVLVMASYTFGTMNFAKFKTVSLYILASIFYLSFISLVIYPGLLSSLGKIRYRKFLQYSMPAALIAFTTGSVFLALPVIYELMYKFDSEETATNLSGEGKNKEEGKNIIGFIVPIAWLVPASYKFLVIFYIVFSHWYYHRSLDFINEVSYYILGIPCLFGSNNVIIPLILDILKLPDQAYNTYMIISSLLVYFNNANGAIFIVVLSILSYLSLKGSPKIHIQKFIVIIMAAIILFILFVISLRLTMYHFLVGDTSVKDELTHMQLQPLARPPINITTISESSKVKPLYLNLDKYNHLENLYPGEPLLDKIVRTKILQVGYDPLAPPFSFFNAHGVLVGYDVDFIYDIAENLGCNTIEFYPVHADYAKRLKEGFDIAIVIGGNGWNGPIGEVICSEPYMKFVPALLLSADYRKEYKDFSSVLEANDLTFCIRDLSDTDSFLNGHQIKGIKLYKDYFEGHAADVLLTSAECAAVLRILYPDYWLYTFDQDTSSYYAYMLQYKHSADSFNDVINTWITINYKAEIDKKRYNYWIKGEISESIVTRWTVLDWLIKNNFFVGQNNITSDPHKGKFIY